MMNDTSQDHIWMSRCFDLARRGIGYVSPNPPVGAVLVYENRILGEGYHTYFGGPHAEVNAFDSVSPSDRPLIPEASLYVSLEPCCIIGKTPPCTDLILREGVKEVCIGTHDPNPDISGKSIQLLQRSGIKIRSGILEDVALNLIRPFRRNILDRRPYIILKWAQSVHGYMGKIDEKIWLSHPYTNIWTHSKRSAVDAILVGARTVMMDNPLLTTREYHGRSPHRIIYDPNGRLTNDYRVFNEDKQRVFYFAQKENLKLKGDHILKFILASGKPHPDQILSELYDHQIGILLVEGGAHVHQLFADHDLWDEAWVIQTAHPLNQGIRAPNLNGRLLEKLKSGSDNIICFLNHS